MNRGCFNRQFLAFAIVLMSVYTLIIFILYQVMEPDTKPITVVVTVVATPAPTQEVAPGPPQSPATTPTPPAKHDHDTTKQRGGYTGTTTESYTAPAQPVAPVHYVVRSTVKHVAAPPVHRILYKRKHCVYHHRYRRHHEHKHRHKHHKRCHKKH